MRMDHRLVDKVVPLQAVDMGQEGVVVGTTACLAGKKILEILLAGAKAGMPRQFDVEDQPGLLACLSDQEQALDS